MSSLSLNVLSLLRTAAAVKYTPRKAAVTVDVIFLSPPLTKLILVAGEDGGAGDVRDVSK